MKKIELLAPAGDMERLKINLLYGADAVYFGGEKFGLRANAVNFSLEEIKYAISKGYKSVSLGQARLRTETAALSAVMMCHLSS